MEYKFDKFTTTQIYLETFEEIITKNKTVKNVLDFGTGNTTKLCCKYKDKINYIGIDDNQKYINELSSDLDYPMNIVYLESEVTSESSYYKNLDKVINDTKFDLVSIDGPYGFNSELPRTNILDIIRNDNLNKIFFILMHDTKRDGEKKLIKEIVGCLINKGFSFKVKVIDEPRGSVCITNIL